MSDVQLYKRIKPDDKSKCDNLECITAEDINWHSFEIELISEAQLKSFLEW